MSSERCGGNFIVRNCNTKSNLFIATWGGINTVGRVCAIAISGGWCGSRGGRWLSCSHSFGSGGW